MAGMEHDGRSPRPSRAPGVTDWWDVVSTVLGMRLEGGADAEPSTEDQGGAPCPAEPGCSFIGKAWDAQGNCFCIYSCPQGLLATRCP